MTSRRRPDRPPRGAPIPPLLAGGLGLLCGVALWWILGRALQQARPLLAPSVLEARRLGLMSWTVVEGYDTGQEALLWLLGCLVIPASAWLLWLKAGGGGAGRRSAPAPRAPLLPAWAPALGILGVGAAAVLRGGAGFVHDPSPWGTFGLLGEEGVYLGAVQALHSGRTLYQDLDFPYGPLLIQPLRLWLWAFGETVAHARAFTLTLHGLGVVVAGAALIGLAGPRRGGWLGLGAAAALALGAPLFLPNLNSALLRPVLAFLPAAMAFAAARRQGLVPGQPAPGGTPPRRRPVDGFTMAGALAALAGLVSFEVGVAGSVGLLTSLALLGAGRRALGRAVVGGLVTALLGLATIGSWGGVRGFFAQAWQMVTLPALGYQSLPYPDAFGLLRDAQGARGGYPPGDAATWAWSVVPPIVIWLGLAVGLCRPRRGSGPSAHAPLLACSVTAAVLFRAALGRSDLYHLWFYGAAPAALLLALLLDRLHAALAPELRPVVPALAALLTLGAIALDAEQAVRFPALEEERLGEEAGIDDPLVPVPLTAERAGVEALPRLARQVEAAVRRVRQLPAGDGVWFYPSEATYAFLCDRPLPTRFLWAYDAATPAMQREAIEDLEASAPRWVLRSADTFPIDWIPQDRLVPELEAYLASHYVLVETLPGAELLRRAAP